MKTIVICASTVFYDHAVALADELETQGFKAIVPIDAEGIRQGRPYDGIKAKTWYQNPADFHLKGELMHDHFDKVAAGDAVLVINDEKHGVPGYIGPNVLMEMGLAFHLQKPIYVLNSISKTMPTYEEVLGMDVIMLDGNIAKIDL